MSSSNGDDDDLMKPTPPHVEEGESWLVSYADMMTLLVGFFVILMSLSQIDEEKFEVVAKEAQKALGGTAYVDPNEGLSTKIQEKIKEMGLGEQVEVKSTPFGVEISFQGAVFFDPGSADIKLDASHTISSLMPLIKSEAKDFGVLVEGHTDDVPLSVSAVYRNNWELSSIRATRVLSAFEQSGFDKKKLTAVGYGETRPLEPNQAPDGQPIPANRSKNRRVIIKLLKPRESLVGGVEKLPFERSP